MSIAENIQTMQTFLGYFNPAEAERMAQGCKARLVAGGETASVDQVPARVEPVADERLLPDLSALLDALPGLDLTIEDAALEGDKVAVHLSVAAH
jgi:hypothetical protein